jgi:hypothetical protein
MKLTDAKYRVTLCTFWDKTNGILPTYNSRGTVRKPERVAKIDRKRRDLVHLAYNLIHLRHEHGLPVEAWGHARIVKHETLGTLGQYHRYTLDVYGYKVEFTWWGWQVRTGAHVTIFTEDYTLQYDLKRSA